MEADWSVEIGPDAPVVDPLWPGFVDLLSAPDRVPEIEEAQRFPPLAHLLLRIHQNGSWQEERIQQGSDNLQKADTAAPQRYAFWTAKCDLWEPEDNLWDPDEMSAERDETQAAIACYIDLLPRSIPTTLRPSSTRLLFATWRDAEQSAKALALSMRDKILRCARADFIVRSAITAEQQGFAITVYLAACGVNQSAASISLASALEILASTLTNFAWPNVLEDPIPLQ